MIQVITASILHRSSIPLASPNRLELDEEATS